MDENSKKIYEKYGINAEEREKELQKNLSDTIVQVNQYNADYYRKTFEEGMKERFPELSKYLHYSIPLFTELNQKIDEIVFCLIIEAYSASITLTNHVLERLLKLALIIDEVGLDVIKIEDSNSIYTSPQVDEINKKILNDTINLCAKNGLISKDEKEHLHHFRLTIRNGFSHFDPKKIFLNEEDTKTLSYPSSNSVTKESIEVNYKSIPMLQSAYTNLFAQENAQYFLEVVCEIMDNIQKRIRIKHYNLKS